MGNKTEIAKAAICSPQPGTTRSFFRSRVHWRERKIFALIRAIGRRSDFVRAAVVQHSGFGDHRAPSHPRWRERTGQFTYRSCTASSPLHVFPILFPSFFPASPICGIAERWMRPLSG